MSDAVMIPRMRCVPGSVTGNRRNPQAVMVRAAPMIAIVGGTETTLVVAIAMISPMWGAIRESNSTEPRSSLPGILRSRSDALWLNPFPCMCHLQSAASASARSTS